jgi:hypothetical protein
MVEQTFQARSALAGLGAVGVAQRL